MPLQNPPRFAVLRQSPLELTLTPQQTQHRAPIPQHRSGGRTSNHVPRRGPRNGSRRRSTLPDVGGARRSDRDGGALDVGDATRRPVVVVWRSDRSRRRRQNVARARSPRPRTTSGAAIRSRRRRTDDVGEDERHAAQRTRVDGARRPRSKPTGPRTTSGAVAIRGGRICRIRTRANARDRAPSTGGWGQASPWGADLSI